MLQILQQRLLQRHPLTTKRYQKNRIWRCLPLASSDPLPINIILPASNAKGSVQVIARSLKRWSKEEDCKMLHAISVRQKFATIDFSSEISSLQNIQKQRLIGEKLVRLFSKTNGLRLNAVIAGRK